MTRSRAGFAAFFEREADGLGRAAWERTGDPATAAEVLHTALVRTWVKWPRLGEDRARPHTLEQLEVLAGRPRPGTVPDAPAVPVDLAAVVGDGTEAVRNRRLGWTVVGLATLAVVAAWVVTTVLPYFALGQVP